MTRRTHAVGLQGSDPHGKTTRLRMGDVIACFTLSRTIHLPGQSRNYPSKAFPCAAGIEYPNNISNPEYDLIKQKAAFGNIYYLCCKQLETQVPNALAL